MRRGDTAATATPPAKVLYLWTEYDQLCRIVEGPDGQKRTEVRVVGIWRRIRRISDNEYNLIYRDMAEDWQHGIGPTVNIE